MRLCLALDWAAYASVSNTERLDCCSSPPFKKEEINHNPYWHEPSRKAQEECDKLFKRLQN